MNNLIFVVILSITIIGCAETGKIEDKSSDISTGEAKVCGGVIIEKGGCSTTNVYNSPKKSRPPIYRFSVEVKNPKVVEHLKTEGKFILDIPFLIHSLMDNEDVAHIFIGYSEILNDINISARIKNKLNRTSCGRIEECRKIEPSPRVETYVWDQLLEYPIGVSGGGKSNYSPSFTWTVKIPDSIKRFGVWYVFYQKEGVNNGECVVDSSRPYIKGIQMPYLKTISKEGKLISPICQNDLGYAVFKIPEMEES